MTLKKLGQFKKTGLGIHFLDGTYSSVLNNRPVTLGPDSLLSFNTGKGEVDNRGLMLRAYY